MIRLRKKKPGFFERIVASNEIIPADDQRKGLQFLISLFAEIRPGPTKEKRNAEKNLQYVTSQLKQEKLVLANMQHALYSQLIHSGLTNALTESGIPLARGFWQELSNRLKHKLLPTLQDENDFLYVINNVFFRKSDYIWVESISRQTWVDFFQAMGFSFSHRDTDIKKELLQSLKILSYQVAQLGLEKEVLNYLPDEERTRDTAFVLQNYKVHELESLVLDNATETEITGISFQLKNIIEDCYIQIDHIRESHSEKGASLQQTYLLLILSNRLQRMQVITDVLDADNQFDTGRFVDIFRLLVRNEKRKNSIREFLSQGVGYLAYQIAEHKGNKGNKYITSSRRDFYSMIRSAMWGGFIVCFVAVFKNLIVKLKLAPFPQGFLFSTNYSLGFILIEGTKSTLATKQPAFTASAVASSLDTKKHSEPDLDNLAATVAKVSRSQIASFFGNLIIVFPGTFLLAWGYAEVFGTKIAEGDTAFKLLKDQHPWHSLALLYACFTGFFLFLSGIIAGYWQNKIQYGQIKERLKKHPALKLSMSAKRLDRLANWVEKNFGSLMGNISLGFFLGFAGILGKILGLPFDIRHITISAGNAAIGVYGLGIENIPPYFLLAVFGGVLCIGFLNFLISFSLAFLMAVKSRGIHLSQYPRLFRTIANYFLNHPREFVLPPKKTTEPEYKPLG
ncbi:MAG: site-specific recombinase [Chitinophagaceae bacterium]|nr:site-specific recombinase [Chitinophagaceae bacterium]